MRDEVTYRLAGPEDAEMLAAFGSQSFVDGYGHLNPPAAVAAHVARTYAVELQRAELAHPEQWSLVGHCREAVVGAALLRWKGSPVPMEVSERSVEIARFYVGKPYWRTGVSSNLMLAALQSIRERGGESVWLQVWERSEPAKRFYRKWGFTEIGTTTFLLGTELQRDLIMARRLETA